MRIHCCRALPVAVLLRFFLFLAFFLFFLWRLEGDGGERLAEEARAYGPSNRLAVVSPAKIVRADVS
jgi:hypothetical protein